MWEKIKSGLRKILEIKTIRKAFVFIFKICLPRSLFIKLRQWASFKIYATNQSVSKTEKKPSNIFRVVPFLNQRKKADLVICCAFKGRHEILEKSILESLFLRGDYTVEWFICGSTEEDFEFIQKMAEKTGKVTGMIWRNNPLGEKWHFCVKAAGDMYDADLYAINGSDDIMSSTLIQNIITKHRNKVEAVDTEEKPQLPAMYCTDNWVIICTFLDKFPTAIHCTRKYCNYYVPLGAGRFYTKEFMQQVNFDIFDMKRENCLDDYGYFKVTELGHSIERYQLDDGLLVSVKGNWQQMNFIEDILNAETIDTEDYTFQMVDKFKNEISPEIFSYLFNSKVPKEQYAWAL